MPRKTICLIATLVVASCAPGTESGTQPKTGEQDLLSAKMAAHPPGPVVPDASTAVIRTATAAMETRYPKTRHEVIDDLVIYFETLDIDAATDGLSSETVASCLDVVSGDAGRDVASAYGSCPDLPSSCPGSCEGYVAAATLLSGLTAELRASLPDEPEPIVAR